MRLELRTAGPVARALAYSIDSTVRWTVYFVLGTALFTALGLAGGAVLVLILFLGEWFYPVFFELYWQGQTIGKRALGLRVVNDDGTPVTWASSMLRNLLIAADIVPGTFLAGLLSSLFSDGHRRLGDLAAGTLVIYTDGGRAVAASPAPAAEVLAPPFALELDEQRAIVAFAERTPLLSPERADEIAAIAEPLHAAGRSPRQSLLAIAAGLRGAAGEDAS